MLVVVESDKPFLNSKKSFKIFLTSNDDIKIERSKIFYKSKSFKYKVTFEKDKASKICLFSLELFCSQEEENLESFLELLKLLKKILGHVCGKHIIEIRNDISSELANKAYPYIHEVENLMRKLITRFMLINLGHEWIKASAPEKLVNSATSSKTDNEEDKKKDKNQILSSHDFLQKVDFIHLKDFLFYEYELMDIRRFQENLKDDKYKTNVPSEDLDKLVKKSNWERYFSDIVDCEAEYLVKKWERLYVWRCDIAHNRFIKQDDFDLLVKESSEIKEKLERAINKLNKVEVPEEEKETLTGEFVKTQVDTIGLGKMGALDRLINQQNSISGLGKMGALDRLINQQNSISGLGKMGALEKLMNQQNSISGLGKMGALDRLMNQQNSISGLGKMGALDRLMNQQNSISGLGNPLGLGTTDANNSDKDDSISQDDNSESDEGKKK